VLVVTRLDRPARSTRDLLNILDAIAKAGAGFKSLKDAWADTTTPHGRLRALSAPSVRRRDPGEWRTIIVCAAARSMVPVAEPSSASTTSP
jgi:resolvase-like protein